MEILQLAVMGKPVWAWALFLTLVFSLMAFDLGVLNKREKEIDIAQSFRLSLLYIGIALAFGGWVWWQFGPQRGVEYFTGYAIEMALSIDNVFVISMIFGYFAIPSRYQYRALVWGLIAVIVLRFIMIGVGTALVQNFDWIMYVFGAFLLATGVKMLLVKEQAEPDVSQNPVVKFISRRMRVTKELHGDKFFVRLPDPATGKIVLFATPIFLALCVINVADLIFAVDSVPAIFAITTDFFVVFTSNIMAIVGLRALYFALSAMVHRFEYLKYALAMVLVFIGAKIFWTQAFGKVNPAISLGVTASLIVGGVLYSLWKTRQTTRLQAAE